MFQYFLPKNASQFEVVNTKVLLAFLIFTTLYCFISPFIEIGDETPFFIIGLIQTVIIYFYYKTKSRLLAGNLFLAIWCFCLMNMSLKTGGIYSMDALSLFLVPLIAYCLISPSSGHFWLTVFCFYCLFLWHQSADPAKDLQFREVARTFDRHYYLGAYLTFITFCTVIYSIFSHHYKQLVRQLKDKQIELNQSLRLLQRSKKELQRSNHELEEYANATSHDLKQPIRNVNNFAILLHRHLSKKDKLDERSAEMLGFITEGSDRMLNLISDLLAFSKLKTETDKVFKEASLNKIVEGVLFNLKSTIEQTGTTIQVGALPTALIIPIKLGQVFQNIMSNAIKFRKKEVPLILQVSATETEEFIKISIRDNGIGIEKEFLEKIFAPFKKLHTQREYKGSGIGLATCKHIVELHQGRIWVESEYGEGSTFFFTLSKLLNTNLQENRMLLTASELN